MVKAVRFLALIICVHIIYLYYTWKPQGLQIDHSCFEALTPFNKTEYELEDVYNILIDLTNFTFTVNPQPCTNYTGLLLIIIVSSHPANHRKRSIIRETWGHVEDTTKIIFLLGETKNETTMDLLAKESAAHNDIVQGNFDDTYRNLTYKHVMGLKWVVHYCNMARYVLKTDDDIMVNIDLLRRFLVRHLSPWGVNNLIGCHFWSRSAVGRGSNSKWKVTYKEYPKYYYPDYCSGYYVIYSNDVVMRLLKAAQSTRYFWVDDVHVTGILAKKIGVQLTQMETLILARKDAEEMMLGNNRRKVFVFSPKNLKEEEMTKLWKSIHVGKLPYINI